MSNKGKVNKQKLYRKIEEETDIPLNKVEEAVKHQFSRVAELMASGDREKKEFPSIRLPYWGIWKAKESRVEYIQEKSNDRED